MTKKKKPEASASHFISNWRDYDAPAGEKFAKAFKNLARRALLKPCCGNHGEPGC